MKFLAMGHKNIRGPSYFTHFSYAGCVEWDVKLYYTIPYHMLDESSSYWCTIYGLELCFVVFVFNNQCFDFMYCV